MGIRVVNDENPYAEPKTPLESPARNTGFTTTQGLAIIAICTSLLLSIYHQQYSALRARMRAAAQRASDADARKRVLVNPLVTTDPHR